MEDELFREMYAIVRDAKPRPPSLRQEHSDATIALVLLWAAMCDRPISWAVQRRNLPRCWRPRRLPSNATMSRRLRTLGVLHLIERVFHAVFDPRRQAMVQLALLDAKPLTVGAYSKDRDARTGYVASGRKAKGYKLHLACDGSRNVLAFRIAPMNEAESVVARDLVPTLRGQGYLIADAAYDSNVLHTVTAAHNFRLIQPRRKPGGGLGGHNHHPDRLQAIALLESPRGTVSAFGRDLYRSRNDIEGFFGQLTNFGGGLTTGLPNWVRRPWRVTRWVTAKLIIYGTRNRIRQRERERELEQERERELEIERRNAA